MILSDLRTYLKQQKRVTLHTLVLHFQIEADALRGMLNTWIRKGSVQKISPNANCGTGCCQCDPTLTELYEWVEAKK